MFKLKKSWKNFLLLSQVGLSRSTTGCVAACLFREFQLTAAYEGLVETVPGVNTSLLRMDNYQVNNRLKVFLITLYSWKACKLYEEWGTHSKDFEKFDHKNAIKHENRGPPSQIYSQP